MTKRHWSETSRSRSRFVSRRVRETASAGCAGVGGRKQSPKSTSYDENSRAGFVPLAETERRYLRELATVHWRRRPEKPPATCGWNSSSQTTCAPRGTLPAIGDTLTARAGLDAGSSAWAPALPPREPLLRSPRAPAAPLPPPAGAAACRPSDAHEKSKGKAPELEMTTRLTDRSLTCTDPKSTKLGPDGDSSVLLAEATATAESLASAAPPGDGGTAEADADASCSSTTRPWIA